MIRASKKIFFHYNNINAVENIAFICSVKAHFGDFPSFSTLSKQIMELIPSGIGAFTPTIVISALLFSCASKGLHNQEIKHCCNRS